MPDLPVPRAEWSSTCRQRLRKRWDHVMTVTLLGAGAVFSGVAIFKIGILEELYGYCFLAVFVLCISGLVLFAVYAAVVLYRKQFRHKRANSDCTTTLLNNQEYYRHSVVSDTQYSKSAPLGSVAPRPRAPPRRPSLPLSTPPPSYTSLPAAVEASAAQCAPIYTARRESRASLSSSLASPPGDFYYPPPPPAYDSPSLASDSTGRSSPFRYSSLTTSAYDSAFETATRRGSILSGSAYESAVSSLGAGSSSGGYTAGHSGSGAWWAQAVPHPWPLPPCEGAQWLEFGERGPPREAVEIHNMYHFLVEEEGWISPLMTVSEEDERRRRRYQLIFGHDFFW